jgi:hypothetical protein
MRQAGLTYSVDLALCIDATGSMAPAIDMVKGNALRFHGDVTRAMIAKHKRIDRLRARAIVFRDLHEDGEDALVASRFYDLPAEQAAFAGFLSPLRAHGGGDEPESGLEALATAMHSDWVRGGDRRRHVVVAWTDAPAHRLEDAARRRAGGYPRGLPGSFAELSGLWEGRAMDRTAKRLLLYAPDVAPWTDIQNGWENVVHIVSRAGQGLGELDYADVLEVIANSI